MRLLDLLAKGGVGHSPLGDLICTFLSLTEANRSWMFLRLSMTTCLCG